MPTIKDIAKLAGVSHGTVSNVLNHRSNVSMEKIRLVEDAARKLGYSRDDRGKQLHMKNDPSIAVILPEIKSERYNVIYSTVSQYLQAMNIPCSLYLTGDIPSIEQEALDEVAGRRCRGLIIASCQSGDTDCFKPLLNNGTFIVAVERQIQSLSSYLGFDICRTARMFFEKAGLKKGQKITFVSDLKVNTSSRLLAEEVERICKAHDVGFEALETDPLQSINTAFFISAESPLPDKIFTTSTLYAHSILDAFHFLKIDQVPEIVSLSCSRLIDSSSPVSHLFLDWKKLSIDACDAILQDKQDSVQLLPSVPCTAPSSYVRTKSAEELNIVMLDGPDTSALEKLLPGFTKRTGIKVNIVRLPHQELHDTIQSIGDSGMFDVVRLDIVWLAEFAEKLLKPFDPESSPAKEILAPMLGSVRSLGEGSDGMLYAFPFTPNVQMYFYRKDLFDDLKVRRQYFEDTKQNLAIPSDYPDFCRLMSFFDRSKHKNSPVVKGASMVTTSSSGITCEFLPIFYSFGGKLFEDDGTPAILSEAGRKALSIYLDMSKNAMDVPANTWWKGAVGNFSKGSTAMLNVFINHVYGLTNIRKSDIAGRIGFASVPGNTPLLGGGFLGIAKGSRHPEEALEFIRWACGEYISLPFTMLGGISPCRSIYENKDLLEMYPWLSIVPENLGKGILRQSPAYISENRLEKILGTTIRSGLMGIASIQEVLELAQKQLEDAGKQGA